MKFAIMRLKESKKSVARVELALQDLALAVGLAAREEEAAAALQAG